MEANNMILIRSKSSKVACQSYTVYVKRKKAYYPNKDTEKSPKIFRATK